MRLQDKDFFRQIMRGELGVLLPEPIRTWFDAGFQESLINEFRNELILMENSRGEQVHEGVAFVHSGAFAPLIELMDQGRPDGSDFNIQTIIGYEGPSLDYDKYINNPFLKTVINVWGTGTLAEGDFGPPFLGQAKFTSVSNVTNINIEIKGAFHNDFAYDVKYWFDNPPLNDKERTREQLNRRTNLFIRDLYRAALNNQTESGRLNEFFESLENDGAAHLENGIWKIDPDYLRD